MASVDKRISKGSDGKAVVSWRARWRDPSGASRSRTFARKSDAERHLLGVESAKVSGTYVDASRSRITVGAWSAQWLAGQIHLKESTRARYEGLLRVQVLPTWGTVPLASVTHADVAKWVSQLVAGGLAPSTVRQAHRVLALVLALAVRDGRLPRNPADGVRLPRASKAEKRFLTHGQVAQLAGAAGDYALVIQVLAYCGLRYGELAALRVGRVDLMRRRLSISESASEVGGRIVFSDPKTHQHRSVPVPRGLADQLAQQVAGKGPDEFVFTSPEGHVLRLMNFRRRVFDPAATSVGLAGLTPHELRHTAASLAIASGANVKAVQRLLGHASAAMTLDVYSGLFDDDLDAVAARLDDSLVSISCPQATVTNLGVSRAAL